MPAKIAPGHALQCHCRMPSPGPKQSQGRTLGFARLSSRVSAFEDSPMQPFVQCDAEAVVIVETEAKRRCKRPGGPPFGVRGRPRADGRLATTMRRTFYRDRSS
jgi:hypothetical protein